MVYLWQHVFLLKLGCYNSILYNQWNGHTMYICVLPKSPNRNQLKISKYRHTFKFSYPLVNLSDLYTTPENGLMIITSAWGNGGSGRYTLDCLDPDNLRNNIHHFHINIIFCITAYTFTYYCIINHSKRRFLHLDSAQKYHSLILLCKFDENSYTINTKSCTCIYMYGYIWSHSVLIQIFFPFTIHAKCFKEKKLHSIT